MRPSPESVREPRSDNGPEYSFVLPVYNEDETIPALYERLLSVLGQLDATAEVIFVDDGSDDGTRALLEREPVVHLDRSFDQLFEISLQDSRFKVLQLSRNFGHQTAITAGLDFASGNAVIVMDADLQDPPETVLTMAQRWREGFDVVYAVRNERIGDSHFKRVTAATFYRLLRKLTDVNIPPDVGDFRLVDRRRALRGGNQIPLEKDDEFRHGRHRQLLERPA